MAGAGRPLDDRFDTRLLAFGGYFNADDRRHESRYIMCINAPREKVFLIQHEQPLREIPFESIMCIIPNLKYDVALCLFLNDGSFPVSFFCDSEQDRNMLLALLRGIKDRRLTETAAQVGASADHEIFANKKGRLKWAKRYLVLCRSRLLVFRQKTANELVFPLNMLSLLEPNVIIQESTQHDRSIQLTSQEREFHFQLPNADEVRGVLDVLERARMKAQQRAKTELMQQKVFEEQSRRNMKVKIATTAQANQASRRNLTGGPQAHGSQRGFEDRDSAGFTNIQIGGFGGGSAAVPGPSAMGRDRTVSDSKELEDDDPHTRYLGAHKFDLHDEGSHRDLLTYGRALVGSGKQLKFRKKFKPNKHTTSVFLWGKARPPRLFPQHANQVTPFRHDDLSGKRFIFVTAAKDGTHAFGYTYQDWLFAWGECDYSGALGLGRDIKSTLPFLIRPLRRKKVRQIACSSRHGLALTEEAEVFAWGARDLTGLPADVSEPVVCTFLNNLGITSISAGPVHSAAWHVNTTDLFTWGMPGSWLGLEEENLTRGVSCPFGRVSFDMRVQQSGASIIKTECGNQFSMVLFSDGRVCAFGVNEHGRMGIGEEPYETGEPVFLSGIPPIGDMSCGAFHTGLVSNIGQVYTCGVGNDFRLGHQTEETEWTPRLVDALGETKIVRIECVEDRTFAITEWGCVVMWGCEPVSNMRHTAPFVLEYMRPYRIYQISGAIDFTVALGVHAKEPVPKPEILAYDNAHIRPDASGMGNAITDVAAAMGGAGMNITVLPGSGHIVTQTYQNEAGQVVPAPAVGSGMYGGPSMGNTSLSQFPSPQGMARAYTSPSTGSMMPPPPMGGAMGPPMGAYPGPPQMQRPLSESHASAYSGYSGYGGVPAPGPPGGYGAPMSGPMGGAYGAPMGRGGPVPGPPMMGGYPMQPMPGPPGGMPGPPGGMPGPPGPPGGYGAPMGGYPPQTRPASGSQVRISRTQQSNTSNPMRSVPQTSYASQNAIRRSSLTGSSGGPPPGPPAPPGYGPPPGGYGPPPGQSGGYGPPPRQSGGYGPPPGANHGPPPGGSYGPPPGGGGYGPPPSGGGYGPPPGGGGYGPPPGGGGYGPPGGGFGAPGGGGYGPPSGAPGPPPPLMAAQQLNMPPPPPGYG